ncbi:hypothetical protein [uncultured Cetobacterium sp.]|uniref:hypothetical protein n=1 Tax=uncultured Cetobacterium sp. TaxID=527638 RepID=UPI00261B360B|nr:hypothetical protein [uncultured Cetobacterium sp.]
MKKADSFVETLLLVMEDYEYKMDELEEDIKDLLMSDFILENKKTENKTYFLLESEQLDKNIDIFYSEIEIDKEKFYLVKDIKVSK